MGFSCGILLSKIHIPKTHHDGVTEMEEERHNHGVYGQDNAYDMFINIKVERPNNS